MTSVTSRRQRAVVALPADLVARWPHLAPPRAWELAQPARCPKCTAQPGRACRSKLGGPLKGVRVHSGREDVAWVAGVRLAAVLDDTGLPYLAATVSHDLATETWRLFRLHDRVFEIQPAERVKVLAHPDRSPA